MRKPAIRRSYDASRRQQRARDSHRQALEVACRLFAERGYAETTMEAIAAAAGVALPTLYAAFGSKREMLSRLLDRLVAGEAPSILQTSGAREVFAQPDPRRALALFATHISAILERVTPIHEVMKNAARNEAEVAELFSRAQRNRFANLKALAARLAALGALRKGLTVEAAGRTIWTLASAEVRQMLLAHAGWTPQRYQAWLAQTLVAALLNN